MSAHRGQSGPIPREALHRDHEQRDLSVRSLFVGLLVLGLGTLAAGWLMAVLFGALQTRTGAATRPTSPLVQDVSPPEPRLQTDTGSLVERLRRTERNLLETYAWVDRQAGIARIPVQRAIDVLAERGLPARGVAGSVPPEGDGQGAPVEGDRQGVVPEGDGQGEVGR